MHWIKISCILCMFGCFKDFRPSESYVAFYLTGPWKNFTSDEVNQDIFPVNTYSYTTALIFIFLITDFVRYKPIIILCGLSGFITYILIIFGKTILLMQIMEFFYGLFLSAEVAYYTYIYAKVDKKHYQEVTGHTKAAVLFGRSMSGMVAQITVSFNLLDYHQLNYITLTAFSIATIWALFLPSVGESVYFHRKNAPDKENHASEQENEELTQLNQRRRLCYGFNHDDTFDDQSQSSCNMRCKFSYNIVRAYALLWKHFVQAYTDYRVLKWSVWWALGTCGYLQIMKYIQLLWQDTMQPIDQIYNGAVDFLYSILGQLLEYLFYVLIALDCFLRWESTTNNIGYRSRLPGAIAVFCVGKVRLNWVLFGDILLSVFSFLGGFIIVASSYNYNIWFLYAAYIVFDVIYHTMVTVASFEVAKYICEDSYGLIFGINTFIALVAQSIFTLIVVNTLMLDIRWQYFVYGGYFVVLGFMYLLMGIFIIVEYYRSSKHFNLYVSDENKSSVATQTANDTSDDDTSTVFYNNN